MFVSLEVAFWSSSTEQSAYQINFQYLIINPIILLQYLGILVFFRRIQLKKRALILNSKDAKCRDKVRMIEQANKEMREFKLFVAFITQLIILEIWYHLLKQTVISQDGFDSDWRWRITYLYHLCACGSVSLMMMGISRSISTVVDKEEAECESPKRSSLDEEQSAKLLLKYQQSTGKTQESDTSAMG